MNTGPPANIETRVISSADAALLLGTSEAALRQQRYQARMPGALGFRIGGRAVYDVQDIEQYLDQQKALSRIEVASRLERRKG